MADSNKDHNKDKKDQEKAMNEAQQNPNNAGNVQNVVQMSPLRVQALKRLYPKIKKIMSDIIYFAANDAITRGVNDIEDVSMWIEGS